MAKKALLFVLVALACAACRPSPDEAAPDSAQRPALVAPAGAAWARSAPNTLPGSRRASFASLADRGDLVAYPVPAPAREVGAYTWHRVELSEAHAFHSLESGSLRITSPSGQPLEFKYSRHVEHPSGDWTWVGRLKGGAPSDEAVITFGERATFGSIAEPGKPALRLTTAAGAAWLIETDPTKVADIENEATRPTEADYFIPPDQAASLSAVSDTTKSTTSAPATGAAVAGASAATTVDVVIGYTSGFAAGLGGQSQAVTRLNNLVEITNQAYVNSQVGAAVRMVHAMPVDYADNTSNKTTLEELTGVRAVDNRPQAIPVPASLQTLRNARETYGGDLVTLVRKFQTPENDGCGIAWLIGSERSGIDAGDAPYGYSVVSDGVDTDTDGKSYFCREETLAHELGHNMGSQHDRLSATENGTLKYGVFAYSFGYKTDATNGNFYTVMAYGDRGQVTYRVFSNPRIMTCGGLACGVAEEADNARSLSQTMPIVANFRAATVPPPVLRLDLVALSKLGGSGSTEVHSLNGSNGFQSFSRHLASALHQTGSDYSWQFQLGDYNRDGIGDLYAIAKQGGSGRTEVHVLNGADGYRTFLVNVATALHGTGSDGTWMFRTGDYNRDGLLDVYAIGRRGGSGRTEVHVLNGATNFTSYLTNLATALGRTGSDQSWDFALGDLNRDGFLDLFAVSKLGPGSNTTELHVMNGANAFQNFLTQTPTALHPTGTDNTWVFKVADFNRDLVLDVYAINKRGASGMTEVHVLDGANGFLAFSAHIATALHATGSDNAWEFELGASP